MSSPPNNKPRFRKEEFWMNNYKELYQNGNYVKFFPKYNTTRIEQLNAITRFCIYFSLIILMFNRNEKWLYLPITLIVFIILFYNINKIDLEGNKKELDKILFIRKNKRDAERKEIDKQFEHDGSKNVVTDIDDVNNKNDKDYIKNYGLEAGYIDFNGNLITGKKTNPPKYRKNKEESLFSVDEIEEFKKNTCRRPTKDNPFMNPNITDYNGDPPVACNSDDEDIKDSMTVNYNHKLFRDVDELWERENSQRQFYTIPNTGIPNLQKEFANWNWKVPKTCKGDGYCLRFEDLRFKR